MRPALGILALAACLAGLASAQDLPLKGPHLGAASDFGQTWRPALLKAAPALPAGTLRDEVYWQNVETEAGRFVFDTRLTTYPALLPKLDLDLIFLVNAPHPAHDQGQTPATPEGVQAFADYTGAVLRHFPQITTLEIGNEMNSSTFAFGPGWDGPIAQRAQSYVRLLAATAKAARAAHPGIRILGGAAHSIPLAWFKAIFDAGAAADMDAVVIHPYTVRPEQLARQIALLRFMVPQMAQMPVAVTEFGFKDAAAAPAYLVKSYCQQALSGVDPAIWYPLNPRGDGLAPLLDETGTLTPVGETFRFLRARAEGQPVTDIAPDPFTFGCRFGPDLMLIWGEPRAVFLAPDVQALDLAGRPLPPPGQLSPDVPLILTRKGGINLGQEVTLGPNGMIADSWTQFGYPGSPLAALDPFERFLRQNGQETPLQTRPGQESEGVPWTPYLGSDIDGVARASAEWVLPSSPPAGPISVVYRYRVTSALVAGLEVRLAPFDGGVALGVRLNGKSLLAGGKVPDDGVSLGPLPLQPGDVIEVEAAPNGTGGGSGLRVILRQRGG